MDYKKKYLKYKKKYVITKKINGGLWNGYVPTHNEIDKEIDVYISIKYIKSSIFSQFLNFLKGTKDDKINGKKLGLLRKNLQEIKSKNFTIIDVGIETSNEGNFNGIIVTLNKRRDNLVEDLEEQKLKLKDIDGSIYKELFLNIEDENIIYDSIFITRKNLKRKKDCVKEANKKLEEICKTKDGNEKIYNCKAKVSAIDNCIQTCVIPYKKSTFVINNVGWGDDKCIADEKDKFNM
jgi:hypothetical protein